MNNDLRRQSRNRLRSLSYAESRARALRLCSVGPPLAALPRQRFGCLKSTRHSPLCHQLAGLSFKFQFILHPLFQSPISVQFSSGRSTLVAKPKAEICFAHRFARLSVAALRVRFRGSDLALLFNKRWKVK